jgi:hypothetical protein
MRKFVFLAVVLVVIVGAVDANAGDNEIRLGGGLIFSDSVYGAGAAFDIGLGDRPLALTPFFEYYKDSGISTITAGADILYKASVGDGNAGVYVGAGGGFLRSSNGTSNSTFMIDARAGLDYGITDKIGIYVEGKYLYASKDESNVKVIDFSDVGAFAGLSFSIGE